MYHQCNCDKEFGSHCWKTITFTNENFPCLSQSGYLVYPSGFIIHTDVFTEESGKDLVDQNNPLIAVE